MQAFRSVSAVPCAFERSLTFERFPNAPFFAPIFSGREAPAADALSSSNAAFFSEFESFFVEAVRRQTAPTAEVLFDACGFATLDDFARRFDRCDGVSSVPLLFADKRDVRFLLIAPTPTFRLLFDAALGFDVAAICANEALWRDFNVDAATPLTSFEQEAFEQEAARFATFSPLASDASFPSEVGRSVSFPPTPSRAALALDDVLFYWERRFIRLSNRLFPWTLVFSARSLAPLTDALLARRSSEPTLAPSYSPQNASTTQSPYLNAVPRSPSTPVFPQPSRTFDSPQASQAFNSSPAEQTTPNARLPRQPEPQRVAQPLNFLESATPTSFELAIVVERGEMSAESWRRLQPGDVLTTDVPANALFLGLVDDAPRFLCRPGLFRGAAAVQIKSRADDVRE